MSPVQAACPACGAQITFKTGTSIVTICEFCKSVVARGDRALENLGRVADIVETGSPLAVGLRGAYHGTPFELTGRAQLGHQAGGVWDEWYAAFSDGRWGWLAEAQGRFYLTFQIPPPSHGELPPLDQLQLGQPVQTSSSVPLLVAETGEARALGAAGEIPYRLVPGQSYWYADLSGPSGEFATIDYSEATPTMFIGREVGLRDLGFADSGPAPEREVRHVGGIQLSCPRCGGPLTLQAPDKSERVTCPNCGSLLDINQGRLQWFKALAPGKVQPILPIGSTADFRGGKFTVIGFMQRSVEFEGVRYHWEEYLLYDPTIGFRWLVRSDDQWSFVETVPPGAVQMPGERVARYNGKSFKIYQDAMARVEYVSGEFYWKVTDQEVVRAIDFVHPPEMLSMEVTSHPAGPASGHGHGGGSTSGEINWSLGVYVTRGEVEKAFGVTGLPKASKPAPHQEFPHKAIYKYWALATLLTFIMAVFFSATVPEKQVFQSAYKLEPVATAEGTQTVFTDPIPIAGNRNLEVTATANVNNSWLYIDGDFIDEGTGLVQSFSLPVEYYSGSDSDGAWSEGSTQAKVALSALPPGSYTMRLEVSWQNWQQPALLNVQVKQGVASGSYILIVWAVISVVPFVVMIMHYSFSRRRWEDSDYSPFRGSSG
jgi:hypothetical protein